MLSLLGCNNNKSLKNPYEQLDSIKDRQSIREDKKFELQTNHFKKILEFPEIKDTPNFILELKQNCNLEIDDPFSNKANQTITAYRKIKIFGSNKEFIFLEYDYKDGSMASYPWKYQFLFSKDGKLIKLFGAQRFEFITIIDKQDPFLMTVLSTSKGNGGHEIYKFTSDTLESVFDGFLDYFPRTYDAHEDNNINEPHELKLTIVDENKDGFSDIIFSGKIIHNKYSNSIDDKNNNEIIPVKYIFLYDKLSGHFIEREDYSKKYLYLD